MANTTFQLKRSSVAGKQPNTSTLSIGELALNITDQKIYSSNGTGIFEPAANVSDQRVTNSLTIDNDKNIYFKTVNTSAAVGFRQQNDDNFVMYSTTTAYGQRPVWSIYANSNTSAFSLSVPSIFNANINLGGVSVTSNGSTGTAGQYLTSNGTATYWSSPGVASVNTSAQWSWTNTHTFSANVTFSGNGIGITSNTGAIYLGGIADANWKIARNSGVVTKWRYTNNTVDIVTANSNLEGMAIGLVAGNSYFETGYLGTYIASNVTIGNATSNSTINSTAFSGTANNSTNFNGVSYATLTGTITSNAATAYTNAVSYVDTKIGTANTAITGNAATAYTNAVSYVDNKIATVNTAITGNAATAYTNATSYTDTKIGTANTAMAANAAAAYTNAVSYVDTKIGTANTAMAANAAAAYTNAIAIAANATNLTSGTVAEARLPFRMNQNVTTTNNVTFANIALTGGTISTTPSNSTDIVNKQYADAIATGVNFHAAVRLVTNTDLGTVTYNNGTSGVGATLTKTTTFAAFVVDTVTAAYQDRILVRAQTNTALNGIYTVSNTGNASSAWVLTRATDYDYVGSGYNEIDKGDLIYVTEGSVGAGTSWVESATVTTIGTDPITFVQFSSKALYALTGGTGLYYAVGAAYDGSAATTLAVNSSYIATISANNASYLGTVAAASYQGTANLAAAVALLPANNASYLGGTIASSYLANTSYGLSQNTSGIFVVAGTGTVVNATGVHVNATYIGTISANNASYLGTVAAASYQGTANLAAAVALLPANNASFLGGTAAASYQLNSTLATNVAILTANNANNLGGTIASSFVANTSGGLSQNTSGHFVVAGTGAVVNATGVHVNATYIGTISANNASFLGGTAAASYQLNSTLAANVAILTANNANNLGGVAASGYQTTAGLSANVATLTSNNATNAFGKTEGNLNVNNATTALTANNASYLGGTIASSYLANTSYGLSQNTSGHFVVAGTGAVVNATGVHVNATYIGTISANNASFLGGTAAASYQLNSTLAANVAILTANNANNLGGTAASSYQLNSTLAANVAILTANNANNLGGVAASSYVNTSGSYTLSGNLTFTGANIQLNSASLGGTATNYVNNFIINTNVGNASYLRFYTYRHTTGGDWGGVSTRIQQRIDVTDQAYIEFNPSGYTYGLGLYGSTGKGLTIDQNGQSFFSNNVSLGTFALGANGTYGTSGQVLTSNGTSTYWATVSAGSSANSTGGTGAVQYYNGTTLGSSANIIFSGTQLTVGNSTANSSLNQNQLYGTLGMGNANTFNLGSYTTSAAINQMIVGPFTVAAGNTITVAAGSRLVIV